MKVNLTDKLKTRYPQATFGSLIIKEIPNRKKNDILEEKKLSLEQKIKRGQIDANKDDIIKNYNGYFKKWKKTYPLRFQLETIKRGGKFPQISLLVDSMFLAELKNRILTSGHDLDEIKGNLIFDISKEAKEYLKLNGQTQKLKKDDIILKDQKGILASILYGPAKRTSISLKTKNVLYFAWCPYQIKEGVMVNHLNDIVSSLKLAFKSLIPKIKNHC